VLKIENLCLEIGGTQILKNIDFALSPGKITGVIGESGSGKSMTAFSVMGLLPKLSKVSGRILLEGTDLAKMPEKQICGIRGKRIGMVFQEPMTALNPLMTIGDQVAETVLIHTRTSRDKARSIAREMLDRVGLPADKFSLDRYPHELSGGQRQRVVIAMAISLRPEVLIADEPTTALDVTTQAKILDLLKSLVTVEGMSLMLITHDLAILADIADWLVVMRGGEIMEQGEAAPLLSAMSHPYTRALFEASGHIPVRAPVPVTDDPEPLLEVSGMIRDYGKAGKGLFKSPAPFRAVDDVSFSVRRGESLGLVGESGCGKSTLTRALLALESTQGGTIRVAGKSLTGNRRADRETRRKIQIVFQDPYGSFNPRHRISRLITEPFHLLDEKPGREETRERIRFALTNVGLKESDADKYIHEFSGGQRQRIAIARALIISPALIILDEAVSALDTTIRAQILDLLAELSGRLGVSYLFISHDLSVVRAITDRVMIMRAGKIVETGNTEEIFSNPRHEYTRELLEASPNLAKALAKRGIPANRELT